MKLNSSDPHSRRSLLRAGLFLGAGIATPAFLTRSSGEAMQPRAVPTPASAAPVKPVAAATSSAPTAPKDVRPELFQSALAALERHKRRFAKHDLIALADFTSFSAKPRFQLINIEDGTVKKELLVAHGSGSDPAHSGYVQNFSNEPGSNASSQGAYLTANYYTGKHGHSQRVIGLDPTNDNALDRAIVIHGAWYANADMIDKYGQIGRSQGCFAVGEEHREQVFAMLGEGRMLFAGKV